MVPTLTCCFWDMTILLASFLLSSEDNPRARNLVRCTRNKTQKPPRARAGGGVQVAFSAIYLRHDSGSQARESNDDAEGNDLERVRETDTAKRTMGFIIAICAFDASVRSLALHAQRVMRGACERAAARPRASSIV